MEARIRECLKERFDDEVAQHSTLTCLGGHASLRIYWRVHLAEDLLPPRRYPRGETTLMAMVMPLSEQAMKSEEGGSSADPVPQELPFINVQRYLANIGMPVPAIDAIDMERGVLLLEDLGDEMFEHAVQRAWGTADVITLYKEAIDLLIKFQQRATPQEDCIAWQREFDRELLRWELDHYYEWGLQARLGETCVENTFSAFDNAFEDIVTALHEAPQTLVLRDYQSRNIMRKKDTWIMIDFQDALVGPCIYDLVALLRDSYIELSPVAVEQLLEYYIVQGREGGLSWCEDAESVRRWFYLQTVQRKLKDAGRFVFIDRVKGNPDFLRYYEPSIGYVRHALSHLPELHQLHSLLSEIEPAMSA